MDSSAAMSFWDGYFLWREPLLALVVVAVGCGFLGVYVVMKRVVFVAAALGQVASVGVAVAFLVADIFNTGSDHAHVTPLWGNPMASALLFVVVAAALLSGRADHRRLTQESVVGLAYLVAASLVILIADRIPQGAHDINDILFGSAVAIEDAQLYIIIGLTLALAALHLSLFKEFVFVSFDPDMATTVGLPTRRLNVALFVSVGVLIAVATKAVGALPVFAFLVLPPIGALLITSGLKKAFVASVALAVAAAGLGYYCSWIWSLPTGATVVAVSALLIAPCAAFRGLKGGR